MDLGSRIRGRRKALNLSQEALARRADVSLNLINRIERAETRDPHYSTLVAVARALGISVGELLEEPALAGGKAEAPEEAGPAQLRRAQEAGRRAMLLAEKSASSESVEQETDEERRAFPYPWMADTLAETLARWSDASLAQNDPKYSHMIAVACFDVMKAILKYDVPGKTLRNRVPESEVEERLELVDWIHETARRAQDHYVDSKEAEAVEVRDLEERSDNVVRLKEEIA